MPENAEVKQPQARQKESALPKGDKSAGKEAPKKQEKTPPKDQAEKKKIQVTKEQVEQAKQVVAKIDPSDEQAIRALETLATNSEVYDNAKALLEFSLQLVKYVPSNPEIGAVNAVIAGRIDELIQENPAVLRDLIKIIQEAETNKIIKKGTAEYLQEIQDKDKTQAIKDFIAAGLSGQMPPVIIEKLLDENDSRFVTLPQTTQRAIRSFNNTLLVDSEAIDRHFIESVRSEIAGVEGIDEQLRRELLERLRNWRELHEETVKVESKVERIKDFATRSNFEQLMNRVVAEREKSPAQRQIRDDVLNLVYEGLIAGEDITRLAQLAGQASNLLQAGGLNTEENGLLREAFTIFQQRIQEVETAMKTGRVRGVDYERYGYDPNEQEFIENILFQPKKAIEEIAVHGQGGFEWFENNVKKIFNKLYSKTNRFPRMVFNHSFSDFYDKPVLELFERSVWKIAEYISDHQKELPVNLQGLQWEKQEYEPIRTGLGKELVTKRMPLDEKIKILAKKMMHEFELAEYTHNVYFILLTRGKLEQLAGYSNTAHAVDLDALFMGEKEVEQAYYFMIEEVRKALTNNLWEIDPTLFVADPRSFSEHFEVSCKEKLKAYYKMHNRDIEEWEVDRAVAMARGALLGITGEILDTLAVADAPKGYFGYRGYFGDVVTGAINPMHVAYRFHPGKVSELFYSLARHGGSREGWDFHQLFKTKEKYGDKVFIEGLSGRPIMDMMNLFGSGSVLARKGWRLDGATYHLVEGLNYTWDEKGNDIFDWTNVNPDVAWTNLKRAGMGIAFTWAKKLEGLDGSKLNEIQKQKFGALKAKVTVENVLKETRTRNPLKFLYDLDRSRNFKGSVREKVFQKMPEFQGRDYKEIAGQINKIEDRLMLVQRIAIEENRGILESDFDRLQRADPSTTATDLDLVKRYWRAITDVVTIGREGSNLFVAGKKFKDPEYFYGSEDFNFEDLRFVEGGSSLIGRIFNDANTLGQAAEGWVFSLEKTLLAASEKKDFGPLVELTSKTRGAVQSINGETPAAKLSYYMALINSRYFQKNWLARFPLGVGTLMDTISGESSFSRYIGGRQAWEWDEELLAGYIAHEVGAGNLPTKTRAEKDQSLSFPNKNLICDITLRDEVGARRKQIAFDILRSVIPMIIFLMIYQGLKEETKSQ